MTKMAQTDNVQLSQPLSYKDQAELYKTTVGISYRDPYENFVDPRQMKSIAQTWEKFKKLVDMWIVYDKHRTNGITVEESIIFTAAVGLHECQPSLGKIFSKLPKDNKNRHEFDRFLRGLQVLNYPKMTELPVINYKNRSHLIAPTEFRGSMEGAEEDVKQKVTEKLGEIFRNLNVSLLMLDLGKSGYVSKKEVKILLKAFHLTDGKSNYIISRSDSNGKKGLAYVELVKLLGAQDYPSIQLPYVMGPNPTARHKQVVKGMTARSNYSGSLTSGSSRGSVTDRSSNTSLASYMSNDGGEGGRNNALVSGKWPGHRQMTYSSQGSNRSEKSPIVPSLPELSPPVAVGGLRSRDLDMLSEGGRSRRSNASSMKTGRTLPFMRRSPSKGNLKYTFNERKLGLMKYGGLYKKLNETFVRVDEEQHGYLHPQEIRSVAVRLGMENFEDVLSGCHSEDDRISYVDFVNNLKQKFEPGEPVVYSGAPKRPRRKKQGMKGSGGRSARLEGLESGRISGRISERSERSERSPERSPERSTFSKGKSPEKTALAAFADEFGRLDIHGTGKMSPWEIRAVCRKFDFGMSDEDIDAVMMRCSVEGGRIDYKHFCLNLRNALMEGDQSSSMAGPPAAPMEASSPPPAAATSVPKIGIEMARSPDAVQKIHSKYANLMKAFKHTDRMASGFIQEKELRRLTQIYQVRTRTNQSNLRPNRNTLTQQFIAGPSRGD